MAKTTVTAAETSYRVYRVSEQVREACKIAKSKNSQSWELFLLDAVKTELPKLVEQYLALGIPLSGGRPARLPVGEELLAALAAGSAKTGLAQSALLVASLWRFASGGQRPALRQKATGKAKGGAPKGRKKPTAASAKKRQ